MGISQLDIEFGPSAFIFARNLSLDSRTNQTSGAANYPLRTLRRGQECCRGHRSRAGSGFFLAGRNSFDDNSLSPTSSVVLEFISLPLTGHIQKKGRKNSQLLSGPCQFFGFVTYAT